MKRYLVVGNNTDVGKTVISAILTLALEGEYWKPIEAGGSDTERVAALTGRPCHPPAYRFSHPLSPHHAALLENRSIDTHTLSPPHTKSPLVIEGSGGILCPLHVTEHLTEHLADLFCRWNLSWILVVRHYLGSLNHTLLTIEWLKSRNQQILGIIWNGTPYPEGEAFLLKQSRLTVLGRCEQEEQISKEKIQWYAQQFRTLWRETSLLSGILSPNGC